MPDDQQHGKEVGESAIHLLIDRLENKNPEEKRSGNRIVKTNLVVRGTTK